MITNVEALKILKLAKSHRLIMEINTGDAEVWRHAINRHYPDATLQTLGEALEILATRPRKRGGDITIGDIVEAVAAYKAERSSRIRDYEQQHGRFTGEGITDPAKWRVALVAWTDAIGNGQSGEEAERAAYAAVGVPTPQPETLISNPMQIRNLIETAKRNIAVNRPSAPSDRQTGGDSTHVRGRA